MTRQQLKRAADALLRESGFRDSENTDDPDGLISVCGPRALQPTNDNGLDDDGRYRYTAVPTTPPEPITTLHRTHWDAIAARSSGRVDEIAILCDIVAHERFDEAWTQTEQGALLLLSDGGRRDEVAEITGLSQRAVSELKRRAFRWFREECAR